MHTNPHPKMKGDEASGESFPNQRYEDWEAGYAACWHDVMAIIDKAGLAMTRLLPKLEAHGERTN